MSDRSALAGRSFEEKGGEGEVSEFRIELVPKDLCLGYNYYHWTLVFNHHINSHLQAAIDNLSIKFNVTLTCIDYPSRTVI